MKIKLFLILFVIVIGLFSCEQNPKVDINCKYQGAIIYEKHDHKKEFNAYVYDIKYKGKIITYVRVFDIDSHYNVGDRINGPCRN